MEQSMSDDPQVVDLPDAGVPADQGLSSLALVLQLAGNFMAAVAVLGLFYLLASNPRGDSNMLWVLLILGTSIVRSMFQRAAGAQLLYGNSADAGGRLGGVRRYVIFGIGQSALVLLVLMMKWKVDFKYAFAAGAGLATWPVMLAITMAMPRFKRFKEDLPITEDKGFEGASILMTVLGLCGLGYGLTLLVALLQLPGRALQEGPGVLIVLAVGMLVARSAIHVQAGLSGLRETSVDRSVELANRYANFGVISSFCAGGAMLFVIMQAKLDVFGLALISGLCWMLMAWPLVVRRFFGDRQFVELLAGDNAPIHRRAPDAGLTGLGWLLIAHAAFGASFLIPQIILGNSYFNSKVFALAGAAGIHSMWWSVVLVMMQAWAGYELVRMSPQHRIIGTLYGVGGAAMTMYIAWPVFKMIGRVFSPDAAMQVGPMAINLVLPVATLLLVNRKIAPTARARFRSQSPDASK
jgi:hypothetical protein